ncbi:hypothetical protein ACKVEX_15595 [Rhodocyclaceae bacterium SMB388]
MPRTMRVLFAALAFCAIAAPLQAQPTGQGALSPSQAAFVRAENKRVEDYFVARVARIVAVRPEQVRRAMPDERRITVAVSRLIAALEMDLGRPLSPEQQALIREADEDRLAALARIRGGASQR